MALIELKGVRKVYDLGRGHDARPWCLTVSFTHPHDPYVARQKYWYLYPEEKLPPLEVPAFAAAVSDALSRPAAIAAEALEGLDGRPA